MRIVDDMYGYTQCSNLVLQREALEQQRLLVHVCKSGGLRLQLLVSTANGGGGEAPEAMRAAAINRHTDGPRGQ